MAQQHIRTHRETIILSLTLLLFIVPAMNLSAGNYLETYLDGAVMTICWTATGDDGYSGRASEYDIRYAAYPPIIDTLQWWNQAQRLTNEPSPEWPGIRQCMQLNDLDENLEYYVAMIVGDDAGNWSELSNIASSTLEYYYCADTDGDGRISVQDIIYLKQNIFDGGPPPVLGDGDVNNDGIKNILDIIYMIDHRFLGGPPPICNQ